MTTIFDYKSVLKNIPHKPGIYQFWDEEKELIYIGKAKDLRNRVTSYFNKDSHVNAKTKVLLLILKLMPGCLKTA
jgi:excinuclease ABC subunit C